MEFLQEFTCGWGKDVRETALERGVSSLLVQIGITSLYPLESGEFAFLAGGNAAKVLAIASIPQWEQAAQLTDKLSDVIHHIHQLRSRPTRLENEKIMSFLIRWEYFFISPEDKVQWLFVRQILLAHFDENELIRYKDSLNRVVLITARELIEKFPEPDFPAKAEYLERYSKEYL